MNRFTAILPAIALGGILLAGCGQADEEPATAAPAAQTAPEVTASEAAPAGANAAETPTTGEQEKPADAPASTAPATQ